MTTHNWQPGQQAVINRREVVTIDRVTKGGMAVVGAIYYRPNGRQNGGDRTLEPWTPELQAEADLAARSDNVKRRMHRAIDRSRGQYTAWFGSFFNPRTAAAEEIAKAEELIAAIGRILGDRT